MLTHFGMKKRLISYHDFNEEARLPMLLRVLNEGGNISVITDAGSPGLSDPAYRIIRAAIDNNIKVSPLPGPNALIPALTGSGLPLDRFFFEGFLPNKSGARRNRLARLKDLEHTLIFYESPFRIEKTVSDSWRFWVTARPVSRASYPKFMKNSYEGNYPRFWRISKAEKIKGEIVFLISGAPRKKDRDAD